MPPWELIQSALLETVLRPLVVSTLVFLIATYLKQVRIGAVLAVVLGILASNQKREAIDFRIDSEHPLETKELLAAGHRTVMGISGEDFITPPARYWLPWAAYLAAIAGVFTQSTRMPKWLAWLLRLTVSILIARLLVSLSSREETAWLWPTFTAVVFLNWTILEAVAVKYPGGVLALVLAYTLTQCGLLLLHAHSARLNDIALMTAFSFIGVGVVACRWHRDASSVVPFAAVLIPGLMLIGQQTHTSDVPESAFLIMALSPLMLILILLFNLVGLRSRRWYIAGLVAYLVPAMIAVAIAASHDSLAFD
ncbi:hypothetical protein BH11PLA2_BH11PLA2_39340 [soil metagenome]